jgi:hypothetical protein
MRIPLIIAFLFSLSAAVSAAPVLTDTEPCHADGDYAACTPSNNSPRYILWNQQPHWSDGTMRWYYNPDGQPAWIDTSTARSLIEAAMAKWSAVCNVKFEYQGVTDRTPFANEGQHVIGWGYARGYAGYTQYYWATQNGSLVFSDVDIGIDASVVGSATNLQGLVTHELGHAIGLDHSDVSSAIMFANPYHTYVYQETLRDDDIAGCVALYGEPQTAPEPTTSASDCLFDWAESVYPEFFSPSGTTSATYSPYYYRYYAGTDNFLATTTSDDSVWVLGAAFGNSPLYVGALSDFLRLSNCSQ